MWQAGNVAQAVRNWDATQQLDGLTGRRHAHLSVEYDPASKAFDKFAFNGRL